MGIQTWSSVKKAACILNLKAISLALILKIIFYFMCMCVCLPVRMWMLCMPVACGGQKGVSDTQ